jgi:hypothetical protein
LLKRRGREKRNKKKRREAEEIGGDSRLETWEAGKLGGAGHL